jgi:hypothetical protein
MNKITRVGLLSLIALVQVLTLVSGRIAYMQMFETTWSLRGAYRELLAETYGLHVTFGSPPNPFKPLFPLTLLGLFLTAVLLIDQVRQRNTEA